MDQLGAMRVFAEIAGRGGFAAAARALDMAPSVVTRRVAELEAQLGARLLNRGPRGVALTAIGQRYLQRVQRILQDVAEASALVAEGQQALRGRVRLLAPPLFAARQLMPRLPRLHALHPGIALDITADGAADAALDAHDIGVVVKAQALDGDFVAHHLAQARVLLCATPGYLRQRGRPAHPSDLARHALLLTLMPGLMSSATAGTMAGAMANPMRNAVLTHATGSTATVQASDALLRSTSAELCHAAALAGLGIVALPSFAVHQELEQGRLEPVLPDWHLFDVSVHACLRSRRQVPAAVRATLDFLRAEFACGPQDPWLARRAEAPSALRRAA